MNEYYSWTDCISAILQIIAVCNWAQFFLERKFLKYGKTSLTFSSASFLIKLWHVLQYTSKYTIYSAGALMRNNSTMGGPFQGRLE